MAPTIMKAPAITPPATPPPQPSNSQRLRVEWAQLNIALGQVHTGLLVQTLRQKFDRLLTELLP